MDRLTLNDADDVETSTFETLVLRFGHDCRNIGCNVHGCELCQNNPNRRCTSHFRDKYIDNVNRVFTAQCGAPIQITLHDAVTGQEYIRTEENQYRFDGYLVQLCLLEGNSYEQKEAEVGFENVTDEDLAGMMLLDNTNSNTPEPLLLLGKGAQERGHHTVDHKLLIALQHPTVVLCRTSRSSQSAQGGRTRPFRMLAKAVNADGSPVDWIKHAVSEPFVVTTRRTQGAEKAVVPCEDDPVNKLPGVGKETHAKLKNLKAAGIDYPLPNYNIIKVKDLFKLIDKAKDELLSELGRVLGLTMNKVQDLQQSARTMARVDNRRRVWGHPEFPNFRLLYSCKAGAPLLDPTEEIEVVVGREDTGVLIHQQEDVEPEHWEVVNVLRVWAYNKWWDENHPGWGIWDEQVDEEEDEDPIIANGHPDADGHPGAVAVDSLRDQMERTCKRRVDYRELDEGTIKTENSAQYSTDHGYAPTDSGGRASSGAYRVSSGGYSLPGYPAAHHSHPAASQGYPVASGGIENANSAPIVVPPYECVVNGPDGCPKAPESVFSDGPRQSSDALDSVSRENIPGAQDNLQSAAALQHQRAQNFYNTNSNDLLLDQSNSLYAGSSGLAYITSGPAMETSGPIRFKRSVSGTRYKGVGHETGNNTGHYEQQMPTIQDGTSTELYQDRLRLPPLPPDFSNRLGTFNMGSGHEPLPQRMSRELRSQTSFDRLNNKDPVASWKQNRLNSAASFGRNSQDWLQHFFLNSNSLTFFNSNSQGLNEDALRSVLAEDQEREGQDPQEHDLSS